MIPPAGRTVTLPTRRLILTGGALFTIGVGVGNEADDGSSTYVLGAVLTVLLILAVEAYFLIARQSALLNLGEDILGAGNRLLALVPGKSAPHTEAPAGQQPRRWWQRLTDLDPWPSIDPTGEEEDDEPSRRARGRARLQAYLNARRRRPEPDPAPADPPTTPDLKLAWQVPPPAPAAAHDPRLARFTFADEGRRAYRTAQPELEPADAAGGDDR